MSDTASLIEIYSDCQEEFCRSDLTSPDGIQSRMNNMAINLPRFVASVFSVMLRCLSQEGRCRRSGRGQSFHTMRARLNWLAA